MRSRRDDAFLSRSGALDERSRDDVYNSTPTFRTRLGFEAASARGRTTNRAFRTNRGWDETTRQPRRATRPATPRTTFIRFVAEARVRDARTGSGASPSRSAARITFLTFRAAHLQDAFATHQHREGPLKTQQHRLR